MSDRVRTTVDLPTELRTELKIYAAQHQTTMQHIMEEALSDWLAARSKKRRSSGEPKKDSGGRNGQLF